jgi:hypothetical protein
MCCAVRPTNRLDPVKIYVPISNVLGCEANQQARACQEYMPQSAKYWAVGPISRLESVKLYRAVRPINRVEPVKIFAPISNVLGRRASL